MDRNIPRGQLPTPEPPSLSARRAWIEIKSLLTRVVSSAGSLSARRAWIEIARIVFALPVNGVALRKESVDRNANFEGFFWWVEVALRKESVDRNHR